MSSGTAYWVKVVGSTVYYKGDSDSGYTALTCDVSVTAGSRWRFAVYNDLLIMVNGSSVPLFWDGDTSHTVHRLGIANGGSRISLFPVTIGFGAGY